MQKKNQENCFSRRKKLSWHGLTLHHVFLLANDFSPSSVKTIESVFASCDLSASVPNDRRFHSKTQPQWVQQQLCFTTTIDDFPLLPSAADRVIIYTNAYRPYCNPNVCVEAKEKRGCHQCTLSQPILFKNLLFRSAHST